MFKEVSPKVLADEAGKGRQFAMFISSIRQSLMVPGLLNDAQRNYYSAVVAAYRLR